MRLFFVCVLTVGAIAGCADAGFQETTLSSSDTITDTFTFALPSVRVFESPAYFYQGTKGFRLNNVWDAAVTKAPYSEDSPVSLMRKWKVVHDTFHDTYTLVSHDYRIDFRSSKSRPTVAGLRSMFGRWILFAGDDMARVHEVYDGSERVLVFNDGRAPADTFADDVPRPKPR